MILRHRYGYIAEKEPSGASLAQVHKPPWKRSPRSLKHSAHCVKKPKVEQNLQILSGTTVSPETYCALVAPTHVAPQTHAALALYAGNPLALERHPASEKENLYTNILGPKPKKN